MPTKSDLLQKHRAKRDAAAVTRENRELLKQLDAADRRAGVAEALRAQARPPRKRKAVVNLHRRVATPVFMMSDLHVEETVKPGSVGGLNEYTLAIADERLTRLAKAMCWSIGHHRASFEIREAVL